MVPFSIGKYVDEVLCNVIPMQATHIFVVTHFWVPIKKMKMRKYKKEVKGQSLRPSNIFAYK
jgi:hypothetical protein